MPSTHNWAIIFFCIRITTMIRNSRDEAWWLLKFFFCGKLFYFTYSSEKWIVRRDVSGIPLIFYFKQSNFFFLLDTNTFYIFFHGTKIKCKAFSESYMIFVIKKSWTENNKRTHSLTHSYIPWIIPSWHYFLPSETKCLCALNFFSQYFVSCKATILFHVSAHFHPFFSIHFFSFFSCCSGHSNEYTQRKKYLQYYIHRTRSSEMSL